MCFVYPVSSCHVTQKMSKKVQGPMELWGCKVETYHRRNRGSAGFGFQMGFIENNWILLVSCETLWANWRKMSWDFTTYQDFSSLDFIFTVWTWSSTLSLISDTGLITHTHTHAYTLSESWLDTASGPQPGGDQEGIFKANFPVLHFICSRSGMAGQQSFERIPFKFLWDARVERRASS